MMRKQTLLKTALVGAALFGITHSFAADESLRGLAEERGRYVGAILNSEWFNNGLGSDAETYEQIHSSQFNLVVAENEMKFDATEPSRDNFSFTKGDKMIEYAQKNGMRVRGHALAWHSQVPNWVSNGNFSKTELLSILKNHITKVVTHYKGKVHEWDVVNEAINDDNTHGWRSQNSIWYQTIGPEFIDSAFVWAHAADPDAELCYNDYALEWGIGSGSKAGFLLEQVDKWKANGIPITCVGSQTHVATTHTSTPANIRTLANELKKRGLRLNITELDIGFEGSNSTQTAADFATQGHLYRQFMDVFLEADNMGEFLIWGVSDKYSWLDGQQGKTNGLIYDRSLQKKPAYDSLMASLKAHAVADVTPANFGQEIVIDTSSTTKFGKATYVIVDYSAADADKVGSWSVDENAQFTAPTFSAADRAVNVTLAGCDQADCGYQHAIYTLPDDAVSKAVLSKCENLIITMKSKDDSTNYVNVGVNPPWMSLEYGRPAKVGEWSETSVDLTAVRDSSAAPTQLTFNSNGSGVYVAKIAAVGCPENLAAIQKLAVRGALNVSVNGNVLAVAGASNAKVELFDLQGRPVFRAVNVNGSVSLSQVPSGLYVVRVVSGSQSAMQKISVK